MMCPIRWNRYGVYGVIDLQTCIGVDIFFDTETRADVGG
jgi:hypothetical protein